MNGYQYQYDPDTHVIREILGMPAEWFGVLCLAGIFLFIFIVYSYDWWKVKWYTWKIMRLRKKRLKTGKGLIKSFIIEVAGKDMSHKKFIRLTEDVNKIVSGKVLKEVGNSGKKLDANNIIGITDLPGFGSHFFVIWYREV